MFRRKHKVEAAIVQTPNEPVYHEPKHRADKSPVYKDELGTLHDGQRKNTNKEKYTVHHDTGRDVYIINSGGYISEVHNNEIVPVTGTDTDPNSLNDKGVYNQNGTFFSTAIDLAL